MKFTGERHSRILDSLERIVGKSFATDRIEEIYYYSSDASAEEPCIPAFVVMPGTVGEVQEIIRLANHEKIPVTPRTGGLTLSGLAIPYGGGILLDLKRMDKIIEVNPDSMYAVVECGVTTGQLKTYLEENHSDLWFCMPHAPQSVGVVSNAMIYGAGQVSLGYGVSSDMVNGLEVVLPTGEIFRTGSCALGKSWLTKYYLPDFIGLFLGWFGSTGIITKVSIQLWPKPNFREALFYKLYNVDDLVELLLKLTKSGACEDICVYSWTGTISKERFHLPEKPENVPEIAIDVIMSGKFQEELESKKQTVREIAEGLLKNGFSIEEYSRPPEITKGVLMVPRIFPFMDLTQGGGADYLGCYIPTEATVIAYRKGVEIAKKHGFQYLHFIRPLKTGHLLAIMYIFPFDKSDPRQAKELLSALAEISQTCMSLGGVVWKPSPTIQEIVLKYADSGYINLIKKIKTLLDPNKIMAPRKWVQK
ncbi:MAG: FAD-binding oxidoreductase [Candidatus Freyarchaeum deiterrae]